jgi:hypothetical protein
MPHVAILCAIMVALVSAFAPTSVLADERKCLAIYAPFLLILHSQADNDLKAKVC